MRSIMPWLTAGVATLVITLLLGLALDGMGSGEGDLPAIRHAEPERLGDSNLVEVLAGVPLKERLGRVEWNGSELTLELRVSSTEGRPDVWFDDAKSFIELSFGQLDNVKRLLFRIAESGHGAERRLLAVMDIRAEDPWLKEELDTLALWNPVHDEIWRKRLRLRLTAAWNERFGASSGYTATPLDRF
ncbi:hypothetical protein ACX93W_05605 [Paenibacillus sp. CAU 1782]